MKGGVQGKDIAMFWLCSVLQLAAVKGNMFQLNEVWDQHCGLIKSKSRRCSLKEKLVES